IDIISTTPAAPLVWLPQRVRRLSNRELDNSVAGLLSSPTPTPLSPQLTPDVRQSGFTPNADARVDDALGGQLWTQLSARADEAVTQRLSSLVTCDSVADPRGCAQTFIDAFARTAYRRPLTPDEHDGLLGIYDTAIGSADAGYTGTFPEGVSAVIQAVLQSA